MAHRPDLAAEHREARDARFAALKPDAARRPGKLDEQDTGRHYRDKKLPDASTTAFFYKAVSDAHLASVMQVDLASDVFTHAINELALARQRLKDGKQILVSNMPDHSLADIVSRYQALADIERSFRVLTSKIEIARVFRRFPERIRAQALICFLALIPGRVLRMHFEARGSQLSPERSLDIVRRIQFHQVTLHQGQSASGLSTLSPEHKGLFDTFRLPAPSAHAL